VKKFRRNWTAYAMSIPHTMWLQIPCQYRIQFDWRFFASTAKNWLKVPCEHRTLWLDIPFQSCTQGDRRFPASTAQNSTGNSAPSPPTSPQYQQNFEDSSYRKVSIMVVNFVAISIVLVAFMQPRNNENLCLEHDTNNDTFLATLPFVC
jgi:hypothetical protein